MKRSRFSDEQIIGILKEHQAGMSRLPICAANTASATRHSTSGARSMAAWKCQRPSG